MTTIAYTRVSTDGQTTDSQCHAIGERFKVDRWFTDEAVSGAVKARERPGFGALLDYVREGDTVVVTAIDRLGRNTIDVLETVELLQDEKVAVVSMREGFDISTPIGKAMLTMLAAVAELDRANIKSRQLAGIEKAKAQGKALGREKVINDTVVRQWRMDNGASIKTTAARFGISTASVKRACRVHVATPMRPVATPMRPVATPMRPVAKAVKTVSDALGSTIIATNGSVPGQ